MLDQIMSLVEKRHLMRLANMQVSTELNPDDTLFDWFGIQGISSRIQALVIWGLCACESLEEANSITLQMGLERIAEYRESVMRLPEASPLLYPHYSFIEIIQMLNRRSALQGVVQIFGQSELGITPVGEGFQVQGNYENTVWATSVVDIIREDEFQHLVCRAALVLSDEQGIFGDHRCSRWTLLTDTEPLHFLQLDQQARVCPEEYTVLYCWQHGNDLDQFKAIVERTLVQLGISLSGRHFFINKE